MDWTGAALAAALSVTGLLALMWAGDWLEDRDGRRSVRSPAVLVPLALAAAGGAVAGGAHGALAGFAVVVAGVNVVVSLLLAWGLAGGDGEAHSVIAGLLALPVLFGGPAAFGVASSAADGADGRALALLLLPAVAYVVGQAFTAPPGRVEAAAVGGGLLALPAALLAVA